MKKTLLFLSFIYIAFLFPVGEAGAVFLLISPGAAAASTGEAQVAKVNDAYVSYFSEPYPARSCVEVSALPKDALVEIEVIAARD